jgi:hypothetical protein
MLILETPFANLYEVAMNYSAHPAVSIAFALPVPERHRY